MHMSSSLVLNPSRFRRFFVFLTTHSDPESGDLHVTPGDLITISSEQVKFSSRHFEYHNYNGLRTIGFSTDVLQDTIGRAPEEEPGQRAGSSVLRRGCITPRIAQCFV